MTMQSNYFVTGEQIYTAQSLREQVMNETDWAGAEIRPEAFALFNALGTVEPTKNDHFLINDTIGADRYFKALNADVATAALGASVEINFATVNTNIANNMFRPGMGFVIEGYTGTTYATRASVGVLITGPGTLGGWICKTVWIRKAAAAITATTFDYNAVVGSGANQVVLETWLYLTDAEALNGAAPMASSWYPTQRFNYTQLIRVPYGWENDMASQANLFGDLKANTMKEAEALALGSAEHMMLFGQAAVKRGAADTTGVTTGALGSGGNETFTGGIPFLLGSTNLSTTKTKYHGLRIDTAGTPTTGFLQAMPTTEAAARQCYGALMDFADKMHTTSEPLIALTTKAMRKWILQTFSFFGYHSREGVIEVPGMPIYYTEINLGSLKFRLVVSDELSAGNFPWIFDGTYYALNDFGMFVLNPRHIGIKYREREEYGIMAMRDWPLEPLRRELKYESEIIMEFGVGLEHRHKHGVFYLYGADS